MKDLIAWTAVAVVTIVFLMLAFIPPIIKK